MKSKARSRLYPQSFSQPARWDYARCGVGTARANRFSEHFDDEVVKDGRWGLMDHLRIREFFFGLLRRDIACAIVNAPTPKPVAATDAHCN